MANLPNFPNTRYTFTVKQNGEDLWSMEGQGPGDLEMFAGMASAMEDFKETQEQPLGYGLTVDGIGETHIMVDENGTTFEERDHFVLIGVDDIFEHADLDWAGYARLQNGNWILPKALWDVRRKHDMYHWISANEHADLGYIVKLFRSPRFIQGFIMGCNACGMDFRTHMVGKPYKVSDDNTVTYYDIQGYPIVNPPDMPKRQ